MVLGDWPSRVQQSSDVISCSLLNRLGVERGHPRVDVLDGYLGPASTIAILGSPQGKPRSFDVCRYWGLKGKQDAMLPSLKLGLALAQTPEPDSKRGDACVDVPKICATDTR